MLMKDMQASSEGQGCIIPAFTRFGDPELFASIGSPRETRFAQDVLFDSAFLDSLAHGPANPSSQRRESSPCC